VICDYGCGQEAKFPFKNGKWCCSKSYQSCPSSRNRVSIQKKKEWEDPNSKVNLISKETRSNVMKDAWADPDSKYNSSSCRENMSKASKKTRKDPNSKFNSIEYRNKIKLSIKQIKEKHTIFYKEEEMRYNPDKLGEEEIQVHCKNHNCKNSKEKGGWFIPNKSQVFERIRQLESKEASGGCYLYCSQHCKDTCILFGLRNDPYRDTNKPYTSTEKEVFNKHILKRDNEICYYCGEHRATIVHHLRPQKLEPFFALDPDYAISVCEKCHYKHGHPTGSKYSTGNLAKIVCSVESQKFLNQK